jgi:hypothetical protein
MFIFPSVDKAHMYILLLLQNLVELIDANIVLRGHNRYWSEDESHCTAYTHTHTQK